MSLTISQAGKFGKIIGLLLFLEKEAERRLNNEDTPELHLLTIIEAKQELNLLYNELNV
tara:strand:+ start:774 stop:950 length:177 start_codon:yes stop_codon:yes gene_type:complete